MWNINKIVEFDVYLGIQDMRYVLEDMIQI